jgi:hypothetical protein
LCVASGGGRRPAAHVVDNSPTTKLKCYWGGWSMQAPGGAYGGIGERRTVPFMRCRSHDEAFVQFMRLRRLRRGLPIGSRVLVARPPRRPYKSASRQDPKIMSRHRRQVNRCRTGRTRRGLSLVRQVKPLILYRHSTCYHIWDGILFLSFFLLQNFVRSKMECFSIRLHICPCMTFWFLSVATHPQRFSIGQTIGRID